MKSNEYVKILVVEDDPDTNSLIAEIVDSEGFNAYSVYSGEECLSIVEQEMFDIILLDVMLPRMDGIEVCRRLAENDRTKSIPIIMITAKKELSTKLYSFVAGAKRYLSKPFRSEELIEEINRTLKQKATTQPGSSDPRD